MWFDLVMPSRRRFRRIDRRSAVGIVAFFLLVPLALTLGVAGDSVRPELAEAAPLERSEIVTTTTTSTTTTTTTTTVPMGPRGTPPLPTVPASTRLASPIGVIPTYDAPGGTAIGEIGLFYGYEVTTPILRQYGDWLQVQTPYRPNETLVWVHRNEVIESSTPYRIVVRLEHTDLTLYEAGVPQFTVPVGIGKDRTPTPAGSHYVTAVEEHSPGSIYGPFVLATSSHSEAIWSWDGAGDAITAIHGQISASSAAKIRNNDGVKISNGCVRMLAEDQLRLRHITAGVPVDFI